MLLNFFNGIKKQESANSSQVQIDEAWLQENLDLGTAWRLLADEKYEHAIAIAKHFCHTRDIQAVREACRLIGMSYYRQELFFEASRYFEVTVKGSVEVNDWFNLMNSATLAKRFEVAEKAFNMAVDLQFKQGHKNPPSVPFLRLYYADALCAVFEYQKAFAQIEELKKIYIYFKKTESNFLIEKSIPYLAQTMDVALDIFHALPNEIDAVAWMESFASQLDENGRVYLDELVRMVLDE